jgi:N-methylhydantoinase A
VAVYRIAADIGGTFTDIACLSPNGMLSTYKTPSTPDDLARAIAEGICAIAARLGMDRGAFSEVLHASTVATNAILEGKGAVTALVTTEGFRDVLELRRIRVPRLYEPLYSKPAPLVPRRRRYEVSERLGPKGEVLKILDIPAMTALASPCVSSIPTSIPPTSLRRRRSCAAPCPAGSSRYPATYCRKSANMSGPAQPW